MQYYRQWSAVYASYFTIAGLWTAFGPAALMAVNPAAAPMALSAVTLAYFVATPFVQVLWDRFGFSAALLILSSGIFSLLALAALVPHWLVWCAPIAFFFGAGSYTLCETRMIEDLALARRGHEFGRARKWGSFGFLAAATIGGAVFSAGGVGRNFSIALAVCASTFLLCCISLSRVTGIKSQPIAQHAGHDVSVTSAPDNALVSPIPAALSADSASARAAKVKHGLQGCIAIAAMRLAEAIATTWFGAYWLSTGHSAFETGLLCSLPVAAEFLAMWRGAAFLARFSAPAMMLICCAASVVRWIGTPLCSALWCAVPLQSIHAFTFGFFYPASLLWLKQAYGDKFFHVRYLTESSARGLTAAVTFAAAGWVILRFGYSVLFGTSLILAVGSGLWWLRVVRHEKTA